MKVVIIGAGTAGCVLANLLVARGHRVTVIEKDRVPGGMSKSYEKDGFVHEYGPHILAIHHCTEEAARYIRRHIEAVETRLTSAACIGGTLTYYPPSIHSAERLGIAQRVKDEIVRLPSQPDETNFETYLRSKVGDSLYTLFFASFTRKFWGVEPRELSAEWAKIRKLGESLDSKEMFFNRKWCAYPRNNWNDLFANLLRGIEVIYERAVERVDLEKRRVWMDNGGSAGFDLLISTMHLDDLFGRALGVLQYAGYRIEPVILDAKPYRRLDGKPVSLTYYPGPEDAFCRVTDYGTFQQKTQAPYDTRTIVTYEYPDPRWRLYPFADARNTALFSRYLEQAAQWPCLATFGRMGLYKYLTTDSTVGMAFRLMDCIDRWHGMTPEQRLDAYKVVRGSWND
jgi:UDP-galactopyranose mutase